KMNKIQNIDLEKKEVLVQAGVIIKDLNDGLKEHNLFFPIIPSSHKICQIGGIIATNAAGIRAIHYGKTDNWIKEIQIIDGNGNSQTIKDPTEICGSEGILGIIIGAKLKLTDIPEKRTLRVETFDDIDKLCESVKRIAGNKNITAIEFFGKQVSKIAGMKPQYHLFIEFDNDEGDIKEIDKINELVNLRKELGPLVGSKKYTITQDPKIPMNKLPEFIKWLEDNKVPVFGHIGIGIFHPRFRVEQNDLIIEMFELVKKLGGCISGEHGIGLAKKEYLDSKAIEKFKILKKKYDPKNIFNRGKIYD
ncbi:MAG: FAD-binding oxidoreductase, partial [Candidatus Aenigmarchaeota archaeon]|nr:FAD-binding oxidoreductase [Candidatus Aenigmarchaeota archaeon]